MPCCNAPAARARRRRPASSSPSPAWRPGSVTIAVRDTGGGVAPAIASRMLEPFVTSKDPGQGTGLGLPLAVGIARGMGGRLAWANAAEGAAGGAAAIFRSDPAARRAGGPRHDAAGMAGPCGC